MTSCLALLLGFGRPGALLAQPNEANASDGSGSEVADDESPLLVEPETPEELFDAVVRLVDLGRPELAKSYLGQLMETAEDDEVLLQLRDKHGPAIFLRLANIEALRPLSTRLLERVTQAFRQRGADPEHIDGLIQDLSASPQKRDVALTTLRSTGPIVVPRLLKVLGGSGQDRRDDVLVYTLVQMGEQVIPPLLGTLDAPDEDLRTVAMEALGRLGSKTVVPHLWHPAFAPEQSPAVRMAARRALARLLEESPRRVDRLSSYNAVGQLKEIALKRLRLQEDRPRTENGRVALWVWHPQQETIVRREVSPQAAALYHGTAMSRQALSLAPEDRELQALHLALSLAYEVQQAGWKNAPPTGPGTAHDLALTLGEDLVGRALRQALQQGNAAAAVATLRVLGQIGSRNQLHRQNSGEPPMLAALDYPDPRVQFAAADAVLELDPEEPFPGSSRIVEILARGLKADPSRHVVVVDPNSQRRASVAGYLNNLGFEPHTASTGREAFRAAADRMDVALIALHLNTFEWGLSQTVANLRADARTAPIPLAVYGQGWRESAVASLARRNQPMTYVAESSTSEHFNAQVRPFLERVHTPRLTAEQRRRRKANAAFWLAHIGNSRRHQLFDLSVAEDALFDAVGDEAVAQNALIALGAVSSRTAQTGLQEIVANVDRPAGLRELAALQLAFHIHRYGLMLEGQQVEELRAQWQTAGGGSLSTALATVIGSLKPNAKLVAERLQNRPQPAPPKP